MAWTNTASRRYERRCVVASCLSCSHNYLPVWWGWKRARERSTGPASCANSVTRRGSWRRSSSNRIAAAARTTQNDTNDAAAICEAVARPQMRFVPIKSVEQQAVLAVHRLRQGLVEERTALANRIRGLLTEYGLVIGVGLDRLRKALPSILEDAESG